MYKFKHISFSIIAGNVYTLSIDEDIFAKI